MDALFVWYIAQVGATRRVAPTQNRILFHNISCFLDTRILFLSAHNLVILKISRKRAVVSALRWLKAKS